MRLTLFSKFVSIIQIKRYLRCYYLFKIATKQAIQLHKKQLSITGNTLYRPLSRHTMEATDEAMKTTKLKSLLMIALTAGVIANTALSCVIALQLRSDRSALQELGSELQIVKEALETEIELRQQLFPQLQKSASLLRRYNPRLDHMTALSYACKIYECSDENVGPDILTALIVVESSANHRAVSSEGALGLTQVMPDIWNYDYETLINPYQNIEIGASILKYYIRRHGLRGGLSAYNCGRRDAALEYARKVNDIARMHF